MKKNSSSASFSKALKVVKFITHVCDALVFCGAYSDVDKIFRYASDLFKALPESKMEVEVDDKDGVSE